MGMGWHRFINSYTHNMTVDLIAIRYPTQIPLFDFGRSYIDLYQAKFLLTHENKHIFTNGFLLCNTELYCFYYTILQAIKRLPCSHETVIPLPSIRTSSSTARSGAIPKHNSKSRCIGVADIDGNGCKARIQMPIAMNWN